MIAWLWWWSFKVATGCSFPIVTTIVGTPLMSIATAKTGEVDKWGAMERLSTHQRCVWMYFGPRQRWVAISGSIWMGILTWTVALAFLNDSLLFDRVIVFNTSEDDIAQNNEWRTCCWWINWDLKINMMRCITANQRTYIGFYNFRSVKRPDELSGKFSSSYFPRIENELECASHVVCKWSSNVGWVCGKDNDFLTQESMTTFDSKLRMPRYFRGG